ncbi:MAG: DUF1223 domain-containing protein [Flavobacteriaceae bacterium]
MDKKIGIAAILMISLVIMAFGSFRGSENGLFGSDVHTQEFNYEPAVVLELFTSQGCSSCPPADALLQKVKEEFPEQVYALSYHVDYWDYIGWKDPYGDSKFTNKQREYNIKFKNRSNYTPQLVVNGQEHCVGSNSSQVYASIDRYKSLKQPNRISLVDVKTENGTVSFDYIVGGKPDGKNIRVILVLNERSTVVKKGENRNRTLTHSTIVVAEKQVTLNAAEGAASIRIPEIVNKDEAISLYVLLEDTAYTITAAARHKIERG